MVISCEQADFKILLNPKMTGCLEFMSPKTFNFCTMLLVLYTALFKQNVLIKYKLNLILMNRRQPYGTRGEQKQDLNVL